MNGDYIQGYAKHFDIEQLTRYNTRVEKLKKAGNKWKVQSSILKKGAGGAVEKSMESDVRIDLLPDFIITDRK